MAPEKRKLLSIKDAEPIARALYETYRETLANQGIVIEESYGDLAQDDRSAYCMAIQRLEANGLIFVGKEDTLKFCAAVISDIHGASATDLQTVASRCRDLAEGMRSEADASSSFGMIQVDMASAARWDRLADLIEEG